MPPGYSIILGNGSIEEEFQARVRDQREIKAIELKNSTDKIKAQQAPSRAPAAELGRPKRF